tara:strand:- start:4307 stop:4594 length:288 start_codon:yes stop_codon:yes gene_type:complete
MAHALSKHDTGAKVTVFLMADAVFCAKRGQKTPDGYYNLENMIRRVISAKGRVLVCGACMDARGLAEDEVLEGAARSTMDELAETALAADKVVVF